MVSLPYYRRKLEMMHEFQLQGDMEYQKPFGILNLDIYPYTAILKIQNQ